MRTLLRLLAAGVVALAPLAATASPAFACVSSQPTFAEAVHGARTIARVRIVEGFDTYGGDPARSETYRVKRVLKGTLPELVIVAPAWTSLCHDTIGFYAGGAGEGGEGATIIVALDLEYFGEVIHPAWGVAREGIWGTADVPPAVTTLPELEAAILAELGAPDTSTEPMGRDDGPRRLLGLLAVGVAAFALSLRRLLNGDRPLRRRLAQTSASRRAPARSPSG